MAQDIMEIVEEDQPLDEWLGELQKTLGHPVTDFKGWGECYAAGLSPAQAIACRDNGDKREAVVDYCSTSDKTHELIFG